MITRKEYGVEGSQSQSQHSVASEIIKLSTDINEEIHGLTNRLLTKLSPIMVSERPLNPSDKQQEGVREYPPLFAELRDNFTAIRSAIHLIEDIMERVEL